MRNNKEMAHVSKLNTGRLFKEVLIKNIENIINKKMGYIETYVTLLRGSDNSPQEVSEYMENVSNYTKELSVYQDIHKQVNTLSDFECYTLSTIKEDVNGNPLVTEEISKLIRKKFNLN